MPPGSVGVDAGSEESVQMGNCDAEFEKDNRVTFVLRKLGEM